MTVPVIFLLSFLGIIGILTLLYIIEAIFNAIFPDRDERQ